MTARRPTLTAASRRRHTQPHAPELRLLHRWLDSWRGIGDIVVGMHRAGWDLHMTQYGGRAAWITASPEPATASEAAAEAAP